MVRIRASRSVDHIAVPDGRNVTLRSRTWRAAVGAGPGGLGWTYRHPTRVDLSSPEGAVMRTRVIDHVMVLRVAAALLLLAARLTRRNHR